MSLKSSRKYPFLKSAYYFLGVLALVYVAFIGFTPQKTMATSDQYVGEFWNNPMGPGGESPEFPGGEPAYTENTDNIDFYWGSGSPNWMVQNEDFVARWTKTTYLAAGTYHFTAAADDGVRVYVDDEPIIDAWVDQGAGVVHTADKDISAGNHTIKVEYYENGAVAEIHFNYSNQTDTDGDGVNNDIESAAPNGGDANNDGTADANQPNVASIMNPVTGDFSTLEAPSGCNIRSASVDPESSDSSQDVAFDYPLGLMKFTLNCDTVGLTASITQYYFGASPGGKVLRKYNSDNHSYQPIEGAQIIADTIDGQAVTKASYDVTDGGALDQDGTANGDIVDPAGLGSAVIAAPVAGY